MCGRCHLGGYINPSYFPYQKFFWGYVLFYFSSFGPGPFFPNELSRSGLGSFVCVIWPNNVVAHWAAHKSYYNVYRATIDRWNSFWQCYWRISQQKSRKVTFQKVVVFIFEMATGQNAPTFYQNVPFFSTINHYKQNIFCDSNVYKCLPAIRFCSNILFLLYYIFINLFIKIINLINDDCIKLNLYVSLIITIIICLYRCRWSLMSLITGKKVKTHTSQGIVKNKCTKPTEEFWEV